VVRWIAVGSQPLLRRAVAIVPPHVRRAPVDGQPVWCVRASSHPAPRRFRRDFARPAFSATDRRGVAAGLREELLLGQLGVLPANSSPV